MSSLKRTPSVASAQLQALAWICFCGPGLFNALTSFASGLADPRVAFAGNALVYLSFAICSLLATALVPAIGVRRALSLGTTGYFVYVTSLWNVRDEWLAPTELYYAACVLLGAAAALLWTAQGLMLLSYPSAETQGASVSRFWIVFNLGATAGGGISFALNFHESSLSSSGGTVAAASDGMYAVFLLLMGGGAVLAWLVIEDSDNVVKDDGQSVEVTPAASGLLSGGNRSLWTSWTSSARSVVQIVSSPSHRTILLLLLPLFAYSNWFYAYHSFYNVAVFNARTSGLTSACYWLAQMTGASAAGHYLDAQATHSARPGVQWRTARRFLLAFIVLATVMWMLGWYVQSRWLHLSYGHRVNMDVFTTEASSLLPALLLYIVYGLHDALCQVWLYWFMSLVTSKDVVAAGCFTGIYKGVQAASAALAWYCGAIQMDPLTQLQLNLALCITSVLCALRCCDFALSSSIASSQLESDPGHRNRSCESDKLLG